MVKCAEGQCWSVEWITFTKEMARAALGKYRRDRPLKPGWVAALRRVMDKGLWVTYNPSQTPIGFDREGYRLNGKHRLVAFLESKLDTIVFPVLYHLDPEAFDLFDQNVGVRRPTAAFPDRKNVFRDAARVNWLEMLVQGDPGIRLTTTEFAALADGKWHKQITWADEMLPKAGGHSRAPYAGAFMYVHRARPELADRVARAWANGGEGLPRQVLRLRDYAITRKSQNGNHSGHRLALSFKLLYVMALMDRGEELPQRIPESLAGLRYFSSLMRDGAAARWSKHELVGVEE